MGIIIKDGKELPPQGEGGGLYPLKRRQKTPHYGWAPPRRGFDNRTPNPTRHQP